MLTNFFKKSSFLPLITCVSACLFLFFLLTITNTHAEDEGCVFPYCQPESPLANLGLPEVLRRGSDASTYMLSDPILIGGRVGIGISGTPQAQLDVNGSLKVGAFFFADVFNNVIGIGTTIPDKNFKLDVLGDVRADVLCLGLIASPSCLSAWNQFTSSQWKTGTGNISYTVGHVGINSIENKRFEQYGLSAETLSASELLTVKYEGVRESVMTGMYTDGLKVVRGPGSGSDKPFTTLSVGEQIIIKNSDGSLRSAKITQIQSATILYTDKPLNIPSYSKVNEYFHGKNAEISINSIADEIKHWGMYHDRGSEELRFWNSDDRMSLSKDGLLTINSVKLSKEPLKNTKTYVLSATSARGDASWTELATETPFPFGTTQGSVPYFDGDKWTVTSSGSTYNNKEASWSVKPFTIFVRGKESDVGRVGVGFDNPKHTFDVLGGMTVNARSGYYYEIQTTASIDPSSEQKCFCELESTSGARNCPNTFTAQENDPALCWEAVTTSKIGAGGLQSKLTHVRFEKKQGVFPSNLYLTGEGGLRFIAEEPQTYSTSTYQIDAMNGVINAKSLVIPAVNGTVDAEGVIGTRPALAQEKCSEECKRYGRVCLMAVDVPSQVISKCDDYVNRPYCLCGMSLKTPTFSF